MFCQISLKNLQIFVNLLLFVTFFGFFVKKLHFFDLALVFFFFCAMLSYILNLKGEKMDANSILMSVNDKLPNNDPLAVDMLRQKLEKLNDTQKQNVMQQLSFAKLKSPAFVFWVGNFLFGSFGVARFMIGDTILGIVKLAIVILGMIGAIFMGENSPVTGFSIAVANIWWIIDLFLVGPKLRRKNLAKINSIIDSVG